MLRSITHKSKMYLDVGCHFLPLKIVEVHAKVRKTCVKVPSIPETTEKCREVERPSVSGYFHMEARGVWVVFVDWIVFGSTVLDSEDRIGIILPDRKAKEGVSVLDT